MYPEHQVPPPLPEFAAAQGGLDYDSEAGEIYLYHGTNCYRRWEINRSGALEPGRRNYSFFTTRASDAYTYARGASMRDITPNMVNSLVCEPVVLKVKFDSRTWCQVDFLQQFGTPDNAAAPAWSVAVLGPIPASEIVGVLHCVHDRRLGAGGEATRSFADGTLLQSIYHLRDKLCAKRPDAWVLKKLGVFTRQVGTKLKGGEMPELTFEDNLRRLRQNQLRA